MKLYYHPASPFARKTRIVAYALGVEVQQEFVDLFAGAGQAPEFLKLNAQGKVPTLADGDFSLWESNAIVQYLASKAPSSPLVPKDDRSRADALRWQFWESTSWSPACMIFVVENVLKALLNKGEPSAAALEEGAEKFHRCAKLLDDHLAANGWLVGGALSIADLSVAPNLMYAESAKYPVAGYSNIAAWFEKIQQLPAWKATDPSA